MQKFFISSYIFRDNSGNYWLNTIDSSKSQFNCIFLIILNNWTDVNEKYKKYFFSTILRILLFFVSVSDSAGLHPEA